LLAYSYGSPNWCQLGLSGQSCYTPRLVAMKATLGDFCVLDCSQFLEKRYDDPQYVDGFVQTAVARTRFEGRAARG
jgi:hypothetical protein